MAGKDGVISKNDWMYADHNTLAYFIRHGTEDEKRGAGAEWKRQLGKPFPYHAGYEDYKYPEGD